MTTPETTSMVEIILIDTWDLSSFSFKYFFDNGPNINIIPIRNIGLVPSKGLTRDTGPLANAYKTHKLPKSGNMPSIKNIGIAFLFEKIKVDNSLILSNFANGKPIDVVNPNALTAKLWVTERFSEPTFNETWAKPIITAPNKTISNFLLKLIFLIYDVFEEIKNAPQTTRKIATHKFLSIFSLRKIIPAIAAKIGEVCHIGVTLPASSFLKTLNISIRAIPHIKPPRYEKKIL